MRNMTDKEILALGKDLKNAKIQVLHKHGFSCKEIAEALGIGESVVRRIIDSSENENK